jgi:glutamine synthetase
MQALLAGLHHGDELAACRTLSGKMRPLMQDVRDAADALESLVDDEHWPLPKYREMLFVK